MGTTRSLQDELKILLGSNNVYFQPPSTVRMKYPCFVFERSGGSQFAADNKNYIFCKKYTVTYISNESDPDMVDTVVNHFQRCRYDRPFVNDDLHHDVFTIYW